MSDAVTIVLRDSLLVGAGGFCGAISRYLVGIGAAHWLGGRMPWSTLIVNVVGSFGLAVLLTMAMNSSSVPRHLQIALGAGFFGAFTTFSTFSHETIQLLELGPGDAILNIVLNVVLCMAAAWAGALVTREFLV
jgi:fluoride exporter